MSFIPQACPCCSDAGEAGCACFLEEGDNTTITGTGTEADPFVISAEVAASHTHDGTGGATSLVVGGTNESGATIPTATSLQSVAVGDFANAGTGTQPIAIGSGTNATSAPSATGQGALAVGASNGAAIAGARASGITSIAIGSGDASEAGAVASTTNSIAIGKLAAASGTQGIAIGRGASASAGSTVALGPFANAGSSNCIAIGISATAAFTGSIAIGNGVSTTMIEQVNIGAKRLFLGGPATAPADASLINSQITFWYDEAGSMLSFKVKSSAGVVKNGAVLVA